MNFPKLSFLETTILIVIVGAFVLAVVDPNVRHAFFDLAQACLTAYIARSLPGSKG